MSGALAGLPRGAVAFLLSVLLGMAMISGCKSGLQPIRGTAIRTGPSVDVQKGVIFHLFRDRGDCLGRSEIAETEEDLAETWLCDPFVDRASGQVRFAFQTQQDGYGYPMNLEREDLLLTHRLQAVPHRNMLLTGHKPRATNQLFILLIDVSGSMARGDEGFKGSRMDRVRSALLRNDVVDSFFPPGAQTAVIPLLFSSGDPRQLSQKLILSTPDDYRAAIRTLNVGAGYTHLYNAVRYATGKLLEDKSVLQQMEGPEGKQPVIIAMTDGFNNQDDMRSGKDICRDNAAPDRLKGLVNDLYKRQRDENVRIRPTVYTVGIGRKTLGRGTKRAPNRQEEERLLAVSEQELCGAYANQQVDGDLENYGVDHVAMEWIANAGGGQSFIKQDGRGLAEAFKSAARKKYVWYDLYYSVDPFHLRRSFEVKVGLFWQNGRDAGRMDIVPSGWLDAPPGQARKDAWVMASPYSRTLVLLMPMVSLLVILSYLPSARFNLSRALFSRIRQK